MEGLLKKQICAQNPPQSQSQPALGLHNNSRAISKSAKPKIRIIHIFAPEIIKTDAANFRELVQRLTGKPTHDNDQGCNKISRSRKKESICRAEMDHHVTSSRTGGFRAKAAGAGDDYSFSYSFERIKGEEEIWRGANSGGGFLGGFGDQFECGFMQELNDHQYLPFLEATAGAGAGAGAAAHAHHQMDALAYGIGESQSQLA